LISEILSTGAENARTSTEICSILNLTLREVTQAIEHERRAGAPICAAVGGTARGYYLAATQEEMQRYCDSLSHRAGEIQKTRRACKKTIKRLPIE